MADGRRKARLWESLQCRAKNLLLLPTGSGRHQGSLKQDLVTILTAQRWKGEGRWDGTGRPKAGLVEGVGEEKELSQGVEAEGLVRWSQVWLPTSTHPRWKHSIQSHDWLPRNETIMMTGGNSRF